MQTGDHHAHEPLLQRTSASSRPSIARLTMSSTKEVVTPLDTNIKYRQYKFPKNPTVIDYVLVVPRNFYFYFKNLSDAFGPKFVLLILLVYGFQQGLGCAWFFQARDYYFKDELNLPPAEAQAYIAAAHTPWSIKPMYGIASDTMAFFGYHRGPYISIAGGFGGLGLALLASSPHIAVLAVIFTFLVNFSTATPDVMIDATVAEQCKFYPKFAADLQSLCWGALAVFAIAGYATSGLMIEKVGTRTTFGVLIITSACVFIGGLLNWLGEKPDVDPKKPEQKSPCVTVNFAQYDEHKRLFRLAIFISVCACMMSMVVLLTEDWNIRFSVILCLAFFVAFAVYLVNRKTLPDVANVALFIFMHQALTPDIETAMFYWMTDAEDGPKFSPVFIGIINMMGYVAMFCGVAVFNKYFTTWQYRTLFTFTQIVMVGTNMLDFFIVSRDNTKVGIPDKLMIMGDTTLTPLIRRLFMLPIFILSAKVCPDGAEATLFSMLMALSNFGSTISSYLGSFLLLMFEVTEDNYSNLKWVVMTKSLCRLIPIPLIFILIPDGCPQEDDEEGTIRTSNVSAISKRGHSEHRKSDHDAEAEVGMKAFSPTTIESPLLLAQADSQAPNTTKTRNSQQAGEVSAI